VEGVEDPKAAGLLPVLLKLKDAGEAVLVLNEPNDEVVEVPVFPKEKVVDGVALLFDVLFPKLKEFEFPLLVLVLLLLPKLNCEGEFVEAVKLPKAFGVEVFALEVPNPVLGVANELKDVVPVFPKAVGVEVDVFPKEKADGAAAVVGLFPKENGEPEELFVEGVPNEDVAFEPNEKAVELVVEGAAFAWPKAVGVVEVPIFL